MTSPLAAHPRYGQLLEAERVATVAAEFRRTAPRLFGDAFVFGFIAGGLAKGYATDRHDADLFVCVEDLRPDAVAAYRRWYFELHERLGIAADHEDPGELVTRSVLEEKIAWVSERHIGSEVPTYYEYEAIVWADMLSGAKMAKVGDLERLAALEAQVELLPQRWRSDILTLAGAEAGELWTLPLALLCERRVRYAKLGDNTRPVT